MRSDNIISLIIFVIYSVSAKTVIIPYFFFFWNFYAPHEWFHPLLNPLCFPFPMTHCIIVLVLPVFHLLCCIFHVLQLSPGVLVPLEGGEGLQLDPVELNSLNDLYLATAGVACCRPSASTCTECTSCSSPTPTGDCSYASWWVVCVRGGECESKKRSFVTRVT